MDESPTELFNSSSPINLPYIIKSCHGSKSHRHLLHGILGTCSPSMQLRGQNFASEIALYHHFHYVERV